MAKDYYNILGIKKNASKEEIKKAFHKMAHKYHPDKKSGDEAKFKEINEAYQTLSNEQKRAQYDQFGSAYQQNMGGAGAQGGFGGFDFSGFQQGGVEFDLNDIFSDFFGGGRGRGRREKRGRDISTEISISFKESVFGVTRRMLITKQSKCESCSGSGAKKGTKLEKCSKCNGQGKIREMKRTILGAISTENICDNCLGQGEIPKEKCSLCKGGGVLRKEEEITIEVPAGIRSGEMIRMSGMGEAVQGGTPGDLYIKINVSSHPVFKRDGKNLVMDMSIKLTEALLGATKKIETLGGKLEVKIPSGVSINEILRVKGKGIPVTGSKRGDLLIKLNIDLPKKLSKKVKRIVEDLSREGI